MAFFGHMESGFSPGCFGKLWPPGCQPNKKQHLIPKAVATN